MIIKPKTETERDWCKKMVVMGKSSKYIGVSNYKDPRTGKKTKWQAATHINGKQVHKHCKTEREAAIAFDMMMIGAGKEPVNILKRK